MCLYKFYKYLSISFAIFLYSCVPGHAWTNKLNATACHTNAFGASSDNISTVMSVSTAPPTIVTAEYITNGKVYTSTDGGTNWTTATISGMATGNSAFGVDVAKDTGYIVMVPLGAGSDGVWFSKDNGATFTENTTYTATYKIGVFAPTCGGKIYVAGGNGQNIIYTTDGGTNVSQWSGLDYEVYDVAASLDQTYIVRVITKPNVVSARYSTNGGSSFSASSGYPAGGLYSVTMSADGSYVYAGTYLSTNHLYISTDHGATFSDAGLSDATLGNSWVRTDDSGRYLLLYVSPKAYVNNNYANSANWTEVLSSVTTKYAVGGGTVSRSGKYMVMGDATNNGTYYYSEDYGVSWSTRTISGVTQRLRAVAIED